MCCQNWFGRFHSNVYSAFETAYQTIIGMRPHERQLDQWDRPPGPADNDSEPLRYCHNRSEHYAIQRGYRDLHNPRTFALQRRQQRTHEQEDLEKEETLLPLMKPMTKDEQRMVTECGSDSWHQAFLDCEHGMTNLNLLDRYNVLVGTYAFVLSLCLCT
jgi:hypothetical protein